MSSKPLALILGASNHTKDEREKNDFYATDPIALRKFLDKTDDDALYFGNKIWECACGDGSLSKVLIEEEYEVLSTDLIDRGFGETKDFFSFKEVYEGDILTNPPFKLAEKFLKHGMSLIKENNYVVFFLRLQFLEGSKRNKLFKEYPPKYVYIHSSRMATAKGGDFKKYEKGGKAMCYAWFVWRKGFQGEPTIRWIE